MRWCTLIMVTETSSSDPRKNVVIMAVSLVALGMFWVWIREQTVLTDKQFLRSMIPHHAGAIGVVLGLLVLHRTYCAVSGVGEIRTHGTLTGSAVFKTAAFNHSATTPEG